MKTISTVTTTETILKASLFFEAIEAEPTLLHRFASAVADITLNKVKVLSYSNHRITFQTSRCYEVTIKHLDFSIEIEITKTSYDLNIK